MYKKPTQPPVLVSTDSQSGDRRFSHPSWGLVHISRVSGGSGALFGSNVQNYHHIRLSVGRAEQIVSDLGDTRPFGPIHGELIEFSMSETQWARLLSSIGNGSGVPCTLNYVNKEAMPDAPMADVAESFHTAVKDAAGEVSKLLQQALTQLRGRLEDPKPLGKKERGDILREIESAVAALTDRLPFIQKMAGERIEEQVSAAKADIDSFLQFKAQLLGLKEIGQKVAQLQSGESVPLDARDGGRTFDSGESEQAKAVRQINSEEVPHDRYNCPGCPAHD